MLRGSTYQFRWVVPQDLRPFFGRTEVKRSLKTRKFRLALTRALPMLNVVDQIQQTRISYTLGLANSAEYQQSLSQLRKDLDQLRKNDVSGHLQPPKLFHSLLDEFYQFKEGKDVSDRILKEYKFYIATLKQMSPNIGLYEVDRHYLADIFAKYRNLPKRNLKPYKSKSIGDLLDMDVPDAHKVSDKTVSHVKKLLQGVFAYAIDTDQLTESPMSQLRLKLEDKNRYGVFEDAELSRILDLARLETLGWKRWLLPLAIYTGARRSELVQLRHTDIKLDANTGIHFLVISFAAGSVKTESSNRFVPIHSKLIEEGFLEFVAKQTGQRLFPSLKPESLSKWFSRLRMNNRFNDVDSMGNPLTLHSFRHTFITKCRERNANLLALQQLVGHKTAQSSITDRYTHQVGLDVLKEVVELFTK